MLKELTDRWSGYWLFQALNISTLGSKHLLYFMFYINLITLNPNTGSLQMKWQAHYLLPQHPGCCSRRKSKEFPWLCDSVSFQLVEWNDWLVSYLILKQEVIGTLYLEESFFLLAIFNNNDCITCKQLLHKLN